MSADEYEMKKIKRFLPVCILICAAVLVMVCFTGCLSVNYTDVANKLRGDDYGYTVEELTADTMTNNEISGLEARVTAYKTSGVEQEWVRLLYFTAEEYAIYYYEISETGFLKYGLGTIIGPANSEEAESGNYSGSANIEYSREGRVVIYGTSEAYSDAMS